MVDPGDGTKDLARLRHEHRERLKELAALHDTARLLSDTTLPVGTLLARLAARLPAAMQHADYTTARVAVGDVETTTPGFATTPWMLRAELATADGRAGVIEVAYGTAHPDEQEGPFLTEERALIDSIADMLKVELDRRAAELVARSRQAQLALAASTADLAVWEWSVDEDRVTWSPELARMLQREVSSAPLGTHGDFIHSEDRERVYGTVRAALANPGPVFDLEFRAVRVDRSVIWIGARGRVFPPSSDRGTYVLGVLADITRRKTLEESVLKLQRMEAMGRVAAGVAHDFNNLLGVISINAGELLDLLALDDPRRVLASEISDVIGRGSALTQQLLAIGRKSESKPIRIDPDDVIRRAQPLLKRVVGARARLVLELDAEREVLADVTQLDQVLLNLVVNARDATEDGGTITIATRVDNGHVVISVADTGHGMTPETKARMFEPFYTTKPEGQGTGLGLAVVFGVVQQSNGFVTVESEPEHGARFDVHLPAA